MSKNDTLARHMDLFVTLYESISKIISFDNMNWHGQNGSLQGMVEDERHRLILSPGDMAKAIDKYKRRVIILGTEFGILTIYPTVVLASRTGIPTLSYHTTQSLVDAVKEHCPGASSFTKTGLTADKGDFPMFFTDQLFPMLTEIAQFREARHMYVGDGMMVEERESPRRRRWSRKPKQQAKTGAQKQNPPAADKPIQVKKEKRPPRDQQATIKADQADFAAQQVETAAAIENPPPAKEQVDWEAMRPLAA